MGARALAIQCVTGLGVGVIRFFIAYDQCRHVNKSYHQSTLIILSILPNRLKYCLILPNNYFIILKVLPRTPHPATR